MAGAARRRAGGERRLSGARPLVLIGLPGAGKTTVAERAAATLGVPWRDLDAWIVGETGKSIVSIFAEQGEPHFRALERAAMDVALREAGVIAAGGGWAAEPGNIEAVETRALIIYLSLAPAEAARRLEGATDRPLLVDTPLEAKLTALLAAREPRYRLAGVEIAVDTMSPDRAAEAVATAARHYGGW